MVPTKRSLSFWTPVASPPALTWGYAFLRGPISAAAFRLALTPVLALAPLIFASRFQVTFAPKEFAYRRWAPAIRLPYADIDRIEVANVTPIRRLPIGAFLVTWRDERLTFWLKRFPREAVNRFLRLAASVGVAPVADNHVRTITSLRTLAPGLLLMRRIAGGEKPWRKANRDRIRKLASRRR